MMAAAPARVVIVGRDAALWLTAAALAEAFGPTGLRIAAIELPTLCAPTTCYASLPPLEALHSKLGLDEAALLRATGGSFTLGWNVVGASERPFFLGHGSYGTAIDGSPFFGFWAKARRYGLDAQYEDFSPTAMAARHGRMLIADDQVLVFGRADYGYHLPALPYLAVLKREAARRGVALHRSEKVTAERRGDQILSIRLADGSIVQGDLFVDASGSARVLAAHGNAIERRIGLPPVSRLEAIAPCFARAPCYGEVRCIEGGLLAIHAARSSTYVQFTYDRGTLNDDAVLAAAQQAAGLPLSQAVLSRGADLSEVTPWRGNRVAIGAAARTFAPAFALDLHAVQLGIVHLLSLFPVSGEWEAEAADYNRAIAAQFDRLEEFQAAFYHLVQRGGAFWQQANAAALPPALAHRLATFAARGTISPMESDSFSDDLWCALLTGLGIVPASWPPAVDKLDTDRLRTEFKRMLGFVKDVVLAQPVHSNYLIALTDGKGS